jgi:hypothetical protein
MGIRRWLRVAVAGAFGVVLLLATSATAALAGGPSLTVTNLGQAGAPVEVGQAPIVLASTNGCAQPFTLANESACPPGAWPPLGQQWGPIENVAGGDTLRLAFGAAVSSVSVASTSNYPPGLADPDGKPIANYDVLAESPAAPTSDPAVWLATLPPLDARAISTNGYTFSVVAQDEGGHHGYPFGIRAPRYANEATQCGRAFFSTGWEQYLCFSNSPAPGVPNVVAKKRRKCKKGFHKKVVRGKKRCVRKKRQQGKAHHR